METSLKAIIQGLNSSEVSLTEGTVAQEEPLEVKLANENITLSTSSVTVPRHLTDYEVFCEVQFEDKKIDSQVKVCNVLKEGDKVMMLSYNHGKKYYILDRVV